MTTRKIFRAASALVLSATMLFTGVCSATAASGQFYSDYTSLEETKAASLDVNLEIAEESMILLKNSNDTLPFTGVKFISVFGKDASSFFYAGGGSGTAEGSYSDDEYTTFYKSLEMAGYDVNPRLRSFYDDDNLSGVYAGDKYVNEADVDTFTAGVVDSFARYSDAALIVLGRTGSEGGDRTPGSVAEGKEAKHGLELTDNEIKMVQFVTARFDKVVVIVNSPAQMELGWITDGIYGDIDAALWVGHTGLNGAIAIGEVLNGSVNPSGRTADVYAADFTKDPTYYNVVDNLQFENGTSDYLYTAADGSTELYHAIEYEEGIYYGYRYYETRGYEEAQAGNEAWYDENVVYPFGYGLSYTSFDWAVGEAQKLTDETGAPYYSIDVTVTNVGGTAGKDVVQLYVTSPYTKGGIEKSHVVLTDFAKTELLNPGKNQTVTLTVYEQDMASYDYNDANGNGHTGYELDAGSYELKIMKNSHDVVASLAVEIAGTNYDTDRTTGAVVANRFSEDNNYNSLGGLKGDMTQMSRADFEGTFPTVPQGDAVGAEGTPVITIDKTTNDAIRFTYTPGADDNETGEAWYDYYNAVNMSTWTQDADVTIMASELTGLAADDENWTKFMNQLTIAEMAELCYNGGYKTQAIERVGLPASGHSDGPVAIKGGGASSMSGLGKDGVGIQWVATVNQAATWNTELGTLRGIMVGNEALQMEVNGWYAPGLNLHRSPFGGRNFEYFAEDPILTGKIAAAVVAGVESKGIIAFIKHFAVNNQEEDRGATLPGMESVAGSDNGLITWVSEQALREIYTKAFELCVKEGGATGVMTSMNQIGLHSNSNNFELVMGMLREEWGFTGFTVTDVVPAGPNNSYADTQTLVRNGIDTILGAGNQEAGPIDATWDAALKNKDGGTGSVTVNGEQNDITYAALRLSAQRVIYTVVNSSAMHNSLNMDAFAQAKAVDAHIGVSYNGSIAADAALLGSNDTVYTLVGGALPNGLTMNTVGMLSGTPVESGLFTFEVQMLADGWLTSNNTFTVTVIDDMFEADIKDGKVGENYTGSVASEYLVTEGHTQVYASSTLPAGLTMAEDGTISGTPEVAGTWDVVVVCTDTTPAVLSFGPFSKPAFDTDYVLHYTVTVAD